MSNDNLAYSLNHPPKKLALSLRICVDRMLHDYTHEERMFWAMNYAVAEYKRIEDSDHDLMDYRMAADDVAEGVEVDHQRVHLTDDA